jgi:hypothetical protein
MVSVTYPYGRILDFLDRSRYFFFQVAPQLYPRVWVDPVPLRWPIDHKGGLTLLKITAVGKINYFGSRETSAVLDAYQRLRFTNIQFLHWMQTYIKNTFTNKCAIKCQNVSQRYDNMGTTELVSHAVTTRATMLLLALKIPIVPSLHKSANAPNVTAKLSCSVTEAVIRCGVRV